MIASAPTAQLQACYRLLEIARAQSEAIEASDFEAIDRLLEERSGLQQEIEASAVQPPDPEIVRLLQQVAEADQRNIGRVASLIEETSRSLNEVRQGRVALNGYGRPGAEPAIRGALVDKTR